MICGHGQEQKFKYPYSRDCKIIQMPYPRAKAIDQIIIIITIIITLFESQIILAEHECCTNWGDCKSNKSNQIKCWFLRRGENRSSRRKTSRSRVENQQTQPTYDAGSGNRTRDTLVEGERSHHYTNPAPQIPALFPAFPPPLAPPPPA